MQFGSVIWEQFLNLHSVDSSFISGKYSFISSMSFNLGNSILEKPGVSIINPSRKGKNLVSTVVFLPFLVFWLTSFVFKVLLPIILFINVDLPTPLGPEIITSLCFIKFLNSSISLFLVEMKNKFK